MSNNNANNRNGGRAQTGMLRSAILLTLPFLSFQRDLLCLLKTNLERQAKSEDGNRPGANSLGDLLHKLTARELQALLMVLDPTQAWRRGLGEDFPNQLADNVAEISEKFSAGAANIIEAQSKVLEQVMELLRRFK